jgi:hypothetical protein
MNQIMTTHTTPLEPSTTQPATSSLATGTTQRALWRDLAPICAIVFLEFLAMGLPLAVLPVHVQGTLGLGSFVVGIAIGSQSWATLLTRHAAGKRSDQRGPRAAALLGLLLSILAGGTYALSHAISAPSVALMVLMLGRALLGPARAWSSAAPCLGAWRSPAVSAQASSCHASAWPCTVRWRSERRLDLIPQSSKTPSAGGQGPKIDPPIPQKLRKTSRENQAKNSNPSLSAPAPSLCVAVRRWHPSVLAAFGRCAPPTSPKSVLAASPLRDALRDTRRGADGGGSRFAASL